MVYVINGEHLTRYKLITIDGSQVTTETGIPLALNVVLDGVKSDGSDVRLAKLDGTPIPREIECVGIPSTDVVMIHYPFDTIASTDSQFYIYWGNAALSEPATDSTYGSEAVYDANYNTVFLLNDTPTGSANDINDSTSNANHGTSVDMSSGNLVDGTYGKNIDFVPTADYISCDAVITGGLLGNPFTITTKGKLDAWANNRNIIGGGDGTTGNYMGIDYNAADDKFYARTVIGAGNNSVGSTSTYLNDSDFHVFSMIVDTDGHINYFIIDGVDQGNSSNTVNLAGLNEFDIGKLPYTGGSINPWDGHVAYTSFSTIERGVNYAITQHKNMLNPTASGTTPFYKTFGTPQHQRRVPQFI